MRIEGTDKTTFFIDSIIFWSFCIAVFFTPVSISISTIFVVISLTISIFSGHFFKYNYSSQKKEWFLPVQLLFVIPWLGLLYTDDLLLGLKLAKKTHYWLYIFAILPLTSTRFYMKTIVNSFLLGLSLTAIIYVLQFTGVLPRYEDSNLGFIKHITYSLFLVFGMLISSFYFSKADQTKHKIFLSLLFLLLFFNLIIVWGRVGYLAFIILSPLIIFNLIGKKNILNVILVAALCIGAMFLSPIVRDRVSNIINDTKAYQQGKVFTPVGLRLHMWNGALKIIRDNPFFGVGTGGYRLAMKKYDIPSVKDIEFIHPHNSYLYMAASYGIFGLIILLWLFWVLLKTGWKCRETAQGFSLLSFTLIIIIGSFTGTQILQGQSAMLFSIFIGIGDTNNE